MMSMNLVVLDSNLYQLELVVKVDLFRDNYLQINLRRQNTAWDRCRGWMKR